MTPEPAASPSSLAPTPLARWLLLALAIVSLGLGIAGIFLPILPTTPFVLLAAWAAARSSPRLSAWLESHPRFGPVLRDWRTSGVVRRRTKWTATVVMAGSAVIILLTVRKPWIAGFAIASMGCVLLWLWRRPEGA